MLNNDVLRRLRYALSLDDKQMQGMFALMKNDISADYLKQIMTKEGEPGYVSCRDSLLGIFLDGLIIHYRGLREGDSLPEVKKTLNNNEILQKLRIALSLRTEDVLDILKLANFRLSKGELSAFFRKPDHRNYKECGDQVLRNFLQGLSKKNRG